MKRAQPDKVAPCATQAQVRADNLDDIGARTDFLYLVVAETSHYPPSTVRKRSGKFVMIPSTPHSISARIRASASTVHVYTLRLRSCAARQRSGVTMSQRGLMACARIET